MTASTTFAADHLIAIIERIEQRHEEKKSIAEDISDIYREAKGNGYDVKAIKAIVALRRIDKSERAERQAIIDLYLGAIDKAEEDLPRKAA